MERNSSNDRNSNAKNRFNDANDNRSRMKATVKGDDTVPRMDDIDNDMDAQEAQNVSDSSGRLEGQDATDARNKAAEGLRQNRDDSRSGNNQRNMGNNDEKGRG